MEENKEMRYFTLNVLDIDDVVHRSYKMQTDNQEDFGEMISKAMDSVSIGDVAGHHTEITEEEFNASELEHLTLD